MSSEQYLRSQRFRPQRFAKPLRSKMRRLKDAILQTVENVWAVGFSLMGWYHRQRNSRPVKLWTSPGEQRVLVIAPHPDDEVIGCAGTIARHKQAGDRVCVAIVSDGRRSRALGLAEAEMAARRQQEAQQAAQILRVDALEWFGLPEGAWAADQFTSRLQGLLTDFRPDLIYAPSRVDFHPEHQRVAYLLARLLSSRPDLIVRIYQIHLPLTAILINLVVDTSTVAELSRAALVAHASQTYSVLKPLRLRHYAAHFYGFARQTEEFWEMSAAHYTRLHQRPEQNEASWGELWPTEMFWGLRFHPFSDPLAYWRGQAERRRVAGLAGDRLSKEIRD